MKLDPASFDERYARGDYPNRFRGMCAYAIEQAALQSQPGSMPPDGEATPANDLFLPTLTPAKETDARQHRSSH